MPLVWNAGQDTPGPVGEAPVVARQIVLLDVLGPEPNRDEMPALDRLLAQVEALVSWLAPSFVRQLRPPCPSVHHVTIL